jgi:hypothetical protein
VGHGRSAEISRDVGWAGGHCRSRLFLLRRLSLDHPLAVSYGGAAPGLVAGIVRIHVQLPVSVANQRTWSIISGGARAAAMVFVTAPQP